MEIKSDWTIGRIRQNTPYERYKQLPKWDIIERRLEQLIDNQDIELSTDIDYIVGYLLEDLVKEGESSTSQAFKRAQKRRG